MEFRLLGPLEVEADGSLLPLGSPKQRALLEILLLNANEVVSRDRLIAEVWGEQAPATAPTALQVYVSRLRKLLEPSEGRSEHQVLVTRRPGYVLRVEDDRLDLLRFQRLLRDGRAALAAGDAERATAQLGEALALWRGEPLAELTAAHADIERGHLHELRLTAIEERLEAELALGRHADVVEELETLVVRHPLRERLRGQLMLALYRCGRQAEALETYRLGRHRLRDELGLEPGEALQRLERAILNHDPALDVAPPPARVESIPSGTVTFLFSDIEGSTRLLKELGPQYDGALADHERIMRAAYSAHGGRVVDTQGDSFFVAFGRAKNAVAAAVDAQRDLAAHTWPGRAAVKVRMGLHTGEPRVGGERYVGLGVHKAARIAAAGHGGQVLLSRTARELVEDELPTGVTVRDLGERRLKDLDRPEHLSQLVIEGLQNDFARLRTLDEELRRKRRVMYASSALIGVLAAAVAIPVFALGQGGSSSGTNVAPNSVAVIDPKSNKVVAAIPVGDTPTHIAVSPDAVWVLNSRVDTISRIDPQTRKTVRTFASPPGAVDLVFGAGSLWVTTAANDAANGIVQIDPAANQIVQTVPLGRQTLFHSGIASWTAARGNTVWATGPGAIVRVAPAPIRRLRIANLACCATLAIGRNALWTTDTGGLDRVDTATHEVTHIPLGFFSRAIAFGGGAVWVTSQNDDTVWQINAQTNQVIRTIDVGGPPTGVAVGAGGVWVTTSNGSLVELDQSGARKIRSLTIGATPRDVVVARRIVWVTVD